MHYAEGSLWRPLFEERMLPLQVSIGCSWNRCKFCDMYHEPFKVSSREEIANDIDEMAHYTTYAPKRFFLESGNALALPMDMLVFILEKLATSFDTPSLSIGCFARVTDVMQKSDEDLQKLASLGLDDISIGAETGYDPALVYMDKGYVATDIVEQCARLDAAGISYNFFYLIGMAGKGKCLDAAKASADIFGQTHPKRIMVHTMTIFEGTRLKAEVDAGDFVPAPEKEIIEELRAFIAQVDLETFILGNHMSNTVRLFGTIPQQRKELLEGLDSSLEVVNEGQLERFRKTLKSI